MSVLRHLGFTWPAWRHERIAEIPPSVRGEQVRAEVTALPTRVPPPTRVREEGPNRDVVSPRIVLPRNHNLLGTRFRSRHHFPRKKSSRVHRRKRDGLPYCKIATSGNRVKGSLEIVTRASRFCSAGCTWRRAADSSRRWRWISHGARPFDASVLSPGAVALSGMRQTCTNSGHRTAATGRLRQWGRASHSRRT